MEFNERPLLKDAGTASHEQMEKVAYERCERFEAQRRHMEAQAADEEDIKDVEKERGKRGGKSS